MAGQTKKWRKILYEDQGVPDHHVDESFLDELKKNIYTRTYHYWAVVCESGVVTQQLSSVILFVVIFIYMDIRVLSPELLLLVSSGLTAVGYIVNKLLYTKLESPTSDRTYVDDLKTVVIFAGFSYGLSPVLVSLTETIATDTIYAMTTIMLLANLLFHDYGANAAMVSGVLSLNAALFASVCLASRLHTTLHSFATVTFSVQIFALWPVLRRNFKQAVPSSQYVMTVLLGLTAFLALLSVSTAAAILFSIAHVFITFACPAWLVSLQPYKNNIYGPWDEAVIQG